MGFLIPEKKLKFKITTTFHYFSFLIKSVDLPYTKTEVMIVAKQGMKHYYTKHEKKETLPVPEISGKAKSGKTKARNLIAGGNGKVYHGTPPTG